MSLKCFIGTILTISDLHFAFLSFSCPPFSGRKLREIFWVFFLWHSIKWLMQNSWGQEAWGLSQFHGRQVLGTMQQKYFTLWTALSSLRSYSTCSSHHKSSLLSVPAVCQSGKEPYQKILKLGTVTKCRERQGCTREGRKEVLFTHLLWRCAVRSNRNVSACPSFSISVKWLKTVSTFFSFDSLVKGVPSYSLFLHPCHFLLTSPYPLPPACKPPPVFPGRWAVRRRRPTRD